ncbi:hypothetical protein DV515_00019146, partial [Chloebia gouldiae]
SVPLGSGEVPTRCLSTHPRQGDETDDPHQAALGGTLLPRGCKANKEKGKAKPCSCAGTNTEKCPSFAQLRVLSNLSCLHGAFQASPSGQGPSAIVAPGSARRVTAPRADGRSVTAEDAANSSRGGGSQHGVVWEGAEDGSEQGHQHGGWLSDDNGGSLQLLGSGVGPQGRHGQHGLGSRQVAEHEDEREQPRPLLSWELEPWQGAFFLALQIAAGPRFPASVTITLFSCQLPATTRMVSHNAHTHTDTETHRHTDSCSPLSCINLISLYAQLLYPCEWVSFQYPEGQFGSPQHDSKGEVEGNPGRVTPQLHDTSPIPAPHPGPPLPTCREPSAAPLAPRSPPLPRAAAAQGSGPGRSWRRWRGGGTAAAEPGLRGTARLGRRSGSMRRCRGAGLAALAALLLLGAWEWGDPANPRRLPSCLASSHTSSPELFSPSSLTLLHPIQEPLLETTAGTGINITCSHPKKVSGDYIHFY